MGDSLSRSPSSSGLIIRQLKEPGGLALAFLGMALGLVSVFVLPEVKVRGQWVAVAVIIFLAYIWFAHAALRRVLSDLVSERDISTRLRAEPERLEPRVVQIIPSTQGHSEVILLLSPSRLFGQAMLVSIYYEDERDFEILAGSGRVANIQTNGLIQIEITEWNNPPHELRSGAIAGDSIKLARVLVRPAPTTEFGAGNIAFIELLKRLRDQGADVL